MKNLETPEFNGTVTLADNISHPISKAILKYTNHPIAIAIKALKNTFICSFTNVSVENVMKEIRKLNSKKATQKTDIPIKALKQNTDIFRKYVFDFFNNCVDEGVSPSIFKKCYFYTRF